MIEETGSVNGHETRKETAIEELKTEGQKPEQVEEKNDIGEAEELKKTGGDTSNDKTNEEKGDEEDEDAIVADVDDILNDTENLVSDMNEIVNETRKTSVIKKRDTTFERGPAQVADPVQTSTTAATSPTKAVGHIAPCTESEETPNKKQKISTKQCETCYECFTTDEKLAWHNLNAHAPTLEVNDPPPVVKAPEEATLDSEMDI